MQTQIRSTWDPERRLLTNTLSGLVTTEDVSLWKETVLRALENIPAAVSFRMIDSLHGYEPADMDAHRAMRDFIPLTLARYNFRTAYADLFEDVELPVHSQRGINCTAVAHVHHDEAKMAKYRSRLGRHNEQFFTVFEEAREWLLSLDAL